MLFKARNIGMILLTGLIWGLTSQASCNKSKERFLPPPPTPGVPASQPATPSDTTISYLALGDSYTIGESVSLKDRYPVQAVRLLQDARYSCLDPEIIATTGWTTASLLNALNNPTSRRSYDLVSLLIGVNNQFQGHSQEEYRDQFANLLRQSIQLAGNQPSHVLVLSIPDYSVTPFAHRTNTALIAAQIDSFNRINYELSQQYKVTYLDITGESRKAAGDLSLIASDGLHFSGKEYAIWAEKMLPLLKEILK